MSEMKTGGDIRRRFVRVLRVQPQDGLVAFEFAIGWPDLAVELVLPVRAFDEFCALHTVEHVEP